MSETFGSEFLHGKGMDHIHPSRFEESCVTLRTEFKL
jgi:hypothetical protein